MKKLKNWVHKTKLNLIYIFVFIVPLFSNSCSQLISNYSSLIKVKEVIDGDTFKDENNQTHRILGIDCPETYDSENNFIPTTGIRFFYGKLAKNKLNNEIKKAKTIKTKTHKKDKYGRKISQAYIDNKDIAIELIKNGLAIVKYISPDKNNPFYFHDKSYINLLYETQNTAKNLKVGFWGETNNNLSLIFPK